MSSAHAAELDHQRDHSDRQAKRKWREIESIKDRQRLQRELEELDGCFDVALDDLKF